ncbi:phosphatase PAP2 family protein [Candidatus Saccharibacteria bacterium]|nr:phosphatase PAP2 family protein [Candidatus Saccharibacteria bacterium]
MKESKKTFIFSIIFTVLAVAFTVVVKFVNVRPATLENSPVGLASLNEKVRTLFQYNEQGINPTWDKITDLALAALFVVAAYFVILGIVQLVRRKSLKKVDRELKLLAGFYVILGAIYLFFEKLLVINYRPVLIDGALEASYPSSHVLFALALAGSAILLTRNYIKPKFATIINLAIALLALVVTFGRLLAGVHWFTDVMGSILISAALISLFATVLKKSTSKTDAKPETKIK